MQSKITSKRNSTCAKILAFLATTGLIADAACISSKNSVEAYEYIGAIPEAIRYEALPPSHEFEVLTLYSSSDYVNKHDIDILEYKSSTEEITETIVKNEDGVSTESSTLIAEAVESESEPAEVEPEPEAEPIEVEPEPESEPVEQSDIEESTESTEIKETVTESASTKTKSEVKPEVKSEVKAEVKAEIAKVSNTNSDNFDTNYYIASFHLEYDDEEMTMPYEHQKYLYDLSVQYGYDYFLLLSMIARESRFDNTVECQGHVGYMQVGTAAVTDAKKRLNNQNLDPYDPYDNLLLGVEIYDDCYRRAGNEYAALWSYATGYWGYLAEKESGITSNVDADKAYKFYDLLTEASLNPRGVE